MLARLLDGTTRGARRAAVLAVALAVGVVVGASALGGHPTHLLTVAQGSTSGAPSGSEHAVGRGHAKAAETPDADEGGRGGGAGGTGGVHGACVAAVAQDKDRVGGPHHNHGFAVSRAAHPCPTPRPSGSATD